MEFVVIIGVLVAVVVAFNFGVKAAATNVGWRPNSKIRR
jgi:hypothetical protein